MRTTRDPDPETAPTNGAPTQKILDALRRLVRALRVNERGARGRLATLSPARLFVLQTVVTTPDLSMGELAALTHTDPSSVSGVVRKLVEDGLVTRTRTANDQRRVTLQPTRAGRALVKKAPAAPQHALVRAIDALGPARGARLATLLGELVSAMGIDGEHAPLFFEEPPRRARRAATR